MKTKLSCLLLLLVALLCAQVEQDGQNNRQIKYLTYSTTPTIQDVGSGTAGDKYEAAVRLTKGELGASYGKDIRQVMMQVYGGWTRGAINVYKGSKAGNREPDQLVYTQNIDGLTTVYNYYTVIIPTNSVKIEPGFDYWVSYEVTAKLGKALGIDCGPYVKGKGQWLKYNGVWKELSEYEGSANPLSYNNLHGNWLMKVGVDGLLYDTHAPEIESLAGTNWYGGYAMKLTMTILDASSVPQQLDALLSITGSSDIPVTFARTSDIYTKTYEAVIPAQPTGTEGTLKVNLRDTRNNQKWSDPYDVKWFTPKKEIVEGFEEYIHTYFPQSKSLTERSERWYAPEWTTFCKWPATISWDVRGREAGHLAGHTGYNSMSTSYTTADHNEWLFSPPVELIAGQKYKLRFWYRGTTAGNPEKLAVRIGSAAAVDSMYLDTLYTNENIVGGPYKKAEAVYECKKTGLQYLGFLCFSYGGSSDQLYLDDVEFFNMANQEITKITELNGTHNKKGESLKISLIASNLSDLTIKSSQYKLDGQTEYTDFTLTSLKNLNFLAGTIPAQDQAITGVMKIVIESAAGNSQTFEEPIYWHDPTDLELFDFKDNILPSDWSSWDKDGDFDNWRFIPELLGHNGTPGISSPSTTVNGIALNPDNLLILNKRKIVSGSAIGYWVCGQDMYLANDFYGVGISTTGPQGEYDMIFSEKMEFVNSGGPAGYWFERLVSLEKYAGQDVWIAFRHYQSPAKFVLTLDDITLYNTKPSVGIDPADKKEPLLVSNYPNPFNPATTINFVLPTGANSTLRVYNAKGELVKTLINGYLSSGKHTSTFDATGINSGIYFYRLESAGQTREGKMLMVK